MKFFKNMLAITLIYSKDVNIFVAFRLHGYSTLIWCPKLATNYLQKCLSVTHIAVQVLPKNRAYISIKTRNQSTCL